MSEPNKDEVGRNGNALLAAALAYAQKGWPVFPVYEPNGQGCSCDSPKCEHVAKHPRTPHGFHDATTDPETISEWWRRWPNANVAVRTGSESGVVDLECDGVEGLRTLERLTNQGGRLPDTVQWASEQGPHRLFKHPGGELRSSASKLGPGLDLRGDGAYTIVPPSRHAGGFVRQWVNDEVPIAPLPGWWVSMLKAPPTKRGSGNGAERIREGARNATLASIAGTMRKRGLGETAIRAALLEHNSRECDPPLPEVDVARIAASVAKYPAGAASSPSGTAWTPPSGDPWAWAETMKTFLSGEEVGAEFLDAQKRLVARECVTEIFSPRGVGKSLFALDLALDCAQRGLRVLYLDRDNSRFVVKGRLRGFGAEPETPNLKIITREKCPSLTNTLAWSTFPYADYDFVILDSYDSASAGVGEQDSGKPSRAIAPLLDIARRANGPAVLVLGNTVKTAQHSRCCGVVEDRADIIYEVRDASDFHPSGSKPWVEELPPADAGSWAGRSARRKQRAQYRLAFIASKFRIAEEPEPFILEINTSGNPWTVKDVTDDMDLEGAVARERRASAKRECINKAAAALGVEIERRAKAGEPPPAKRRDAEGFMMRQGLKRSDARECLEAHNGTDWVLSQLDGRTVVVVPVAYKKEGRGHVSAATEPAKKAATVDAECGRPVSMPSATSDTPEGPMNGDFGDSENMAEGSTLTRPSEGESVGTANPKRDATPESWTEEI